MKSKKIPKPKTPNNNFVSLKGTPSKKKIKHVLNQLVRGVGQVKKVLEKLYILVN